MEAARMRATVSEAVPAGKFTTSLIGLLGYCPDAEAAAKTRTTKVTNLTR